MQPTEAVANVQAEEQLPAEPVCRHHWRIDAPNGATSMGRCKICGAVREFANSSSDSIWENDSSDSSRSWRGRGRGANAALHDAPAATAESPAPISESALGNLLGAGYRGRID
jgi:hypothetical protein